MKSIVISQPSTIIIEERDIPEPQSGEVRVKVKLGGICGSDAQIYRGTNPFARYPRVIGHEFFGVIDKAGSDAGKSRIGERVSVDPVTSCGKCHACSIGRPNVCESLAVLGVHRDGGFSEYITVPSQNAHTIPDTIPDEYAVMVEPFSIAANVTSRLSPVENDIAVVYGAGPIGLTCLQVLKGVYRVADVILADRVPERLELAMKCGADRVLNTSMQTVAEQLEQLNIKPTVIIDAACHPAILQEAISIASPAAKIAIMGFSTDPSIITQKNITQKELSIYSSRLNANKFPDVIRWMKNGKIDPLKLISHKFPYSHVADAFDTFEKQRNNCCKILLTFP